MHIRRYDATHTPFDEPVADSELSQKVKEALEKVKEAKDGLKVAGAVKTYTKSDLRKIANDVGEVFGKNVSELKNGYKIEISNGNKPIVIRIMDKGSGGRTSPYFRISIDGKGSLDLNGELSSLRELTHIDISDDAVNQIVTIIKRYKGN